MQDEEYKIKIDHLVKFQHVLSEIENFDKSNLKQVKNADSTKIANVIEGLSLN